MNSATTAASNGLQPDIRCAHDYEVVAQRFMAAPSYAYVAGGSGHGLTATANRAAFSRWEIYPRLLRDVSAGHTRSVLGADTLAHPLLLAPVAFQRLAHPAAELASARAAWATDTCMISSTLSSCTLEEIAAACGPQRWFQLYFQTQRADTRALLARAEAAGYRAIVVTLDATIQVAGLHALRAGFQLPPDCVAANLAGMATPAARQLDPEHSRILQGVMREAPRWDDLAWLLANTSLPVWVKGVMHPDDAAALKAAGVQGLVVSNHGGRSLDGAPASLSVLPAIRAAVGPAYPLLFDGGIRCGADIFKALALGANATLAGRLQMYALAVSGALGVGHMIKLLREELEVCMALAGCATLADITPASLRAVFPTHTE